MPSRRILSLLSLLCLLVACATPARQAGAPPVREDNAVFGNALVHYLDAGQGGTPLVLVHGWGGDHAFWQGQLADLSRAGRVLALDLPGHGLSGKPEVRYTQAHFADAVAAVLDHAGISRAVLAGHSMGASVVRQVALRHPDRVAGLVVLDGALFDLPQDPEGLKLWQIQMQGFVNGFLGPSGEVFTWEFLDSLHTAETPKSVRDRVRETVLATPRQVRVSAMEEFVDPQVWGGGPVQAPTLAVYAVSPDLPPDFETVLGRMFTDLTFQIWSGPGHFLMMERPGAVNQAILEWRARRGL